MDPSFWHDRWAQNQTSFHEDEANALLRDHVQSLTLASGARIFVPLCGKTRDIAWLLSEGYRVVGAELSQIAIDQLFADLGVIPGVRKTGDLLHHHAPGIDIFVGNILDLPADVLGPVDAVYDRAALVALPRGMRDKYAAHLTAITQAAPQLLICFHYDQAAMDGPPFSIDPDEVHRLYHASFDPTPLDTVKVAGNLKGLVPAQETVWHLRPTKR